MGSASIWQPYKPSPEKPKGFPWIKDSEQSSYFCQLVGSSSHTDPCLARGEKRLLIFSTLFLCVIRDGPRRHKFASKDLPFDQFSEFCVTAVKTSKSTTSQLEIILKYKVCMKMWAFSGAWKGKRGSFLVLLPMLVLSYFIPTTEVMCCLPFPYFMKKKVERTDLEQKRNPSRTWVKWSLVPIFPTGKFAKEKLK